MPSGYQPDGMAATVRANEDGLLKRAPSVVPVGRLPTGAGKLPALPIFQTRSQMKTLVLISLVASSLCRLAVADDLDDAFASLTSGRAYLKLYPEQKTRSALVEDFLGAGGQTPNHPMLMEAVQRAIAIRDAEPPDPDSLPPGGGAPRSVQAREIAWQALESDLTGYNYAGNRDLLDAVRIAYPGKNPADDTRQMPKEEPVSFPGTSQKQITYARLYFLQGIKDVLEYVAEDTTGKLRAGSDIYPTVPHYVTFDEELRDEILPHDKFDDPNFGGPNDGTLDREASQSVAYLYGSAMERFGLSAVAYADQLWKSAYAGPGAGLARSPTEKGQMLQRATDMLTFNSHAQFLASLPLAAQLSDGTDGTINEFKQSKIDQARVSVTDALRLREQILAGEKPTQTALVSAWDEGSIAQQIGVCKAAYQRAQNKYDGTPQDESVVYQIGRQEDALTQNANREIELRNGLESQLLAITGMNPSDFGGLRLETNRVAFLKALDERYTRLIQNADKASPDLQEGSLMSIQTLKLLQAISLGRVAQAKVDSYAHKIHVEEERNGAVDTLIFINGVAYQILDYAVLASRAVPKISITTGTLSGTTVTTEGGWIAAAAAAALKALRLATETIAINDVNSAAVVKNLLIEMTVAQEELDAARLNAPIALAELKGLHGTAKRVVEDHIFYQDITAPLWYRDPSLAFKLEKAEEEYRDLMHKYRIELYKLARMLEAAWTERFSNPVKQANGSTIEPIDSGTYDEFTEAESVFSVVRHDRGDAFFNALREWDLLLRKPEFRGDYSGNQWDANFFSGQPISLRRDIFKLIDYRYDFNGNRYELDPALNRQSIQQFRAILLDLANRDPINNPSLKRLRVDFPLTYNQARVILGQGTPVPIVQRNRPAGTLDTFWNHRVKQIGLKITGKNVFPAGNTVPVSIELFGNVDRIGFFVDSLFTFSRAISTF